jgi:hypothetical protein
MLVISPVTVLQWEKKSVPFNEPFSAKNPTASVPLQLKVADDVAKGLNVRRVACVWSVDVDIDSALSVDQILDVIVRNSGITDTDELTRGALDMFLVLPI